ncbi:MAG: 3-phosphoshikimate 1-carboxyvinyltransferase [bacterium]
MDQIISQTKELRGEVQLPRDKSILHRALMISSFAEGRSEIDCIPAASDPISTMNCLRQLAGNIEVSGNHLIIHGKGLKSFLSPNGSLDTGNSGTTMRLLSGILAGQNFNSEITGDASLIKRPMKRILEPLLLMGAKIEASERSTAPLKISGRYPLKAIDYQLPVPSAQVKSAVLLAGLYTNGITRVFEPILTRDHTERMLDLPIEVKESVRIISISRDNAPLGRKFEIPGDFSAAAFFIAAGLIVPNSEIIIKNVGLNPTRTAFLKILEQLGGNIQISNTRAISGELLGDISVRTTQLKGKLTLSSPDVALLIDELPILAVTAACNQCSLEIRDAGELRHKESDRIRTVVENLRNIGVEVEEYKDGFGFESTSIIHGAAIESSLDHRIAMAFAIGALVARGESIIRQAECVDISFPTFWETIKALKN